MLFLNWAGIRAGEINEKQENPASIKKKKNSSAEKVVYKFGALIVDQITKRHSVEKVR